MANFKSFHYHCCAGAPHVRLDYGHFNIIQFSVANQPMNAPLFQFMDNVSHDCVDGGKDNNGANVFGKRLEEHIGEFCFNGNEF